MLYIHYEQFKLADVDAVKLIFGTKTNHIIVGNLAWEQSKQIINLFKQIPSSKRSFDPVTKIWILPESILKLLLVMPDLGKTAHNDLDAWLNPPKNQDSFKWYDNANIKTEAPEDFFHAHTASSSCVLTETELQNKLVAIVEPLVTFKLSSKEDMVRGYKLAARKLHPDLNGGSAKSAKRMSELNSLWMQYKEVAK